jgi:hypothetical protein
MDAILLVGFSVASVLCIASVVGWWRERTQRRLIESLRHSTQTTTTSHISHIDSDNDTHPQRIEFGLDSERNERDIILLPGASDVFMGPRSPSPHQKDASSQTNVSSHDHDDDASLSLQREQRRRVPSHHDPTIHPISHGRK